MRHGKEITKGMKHRDDVNLYIPYDHNGQEDQEPVRVDSTIRSVEPRPAYKAWVGWLDRLANKPIPVEIPENVEVTR